MSRWSVFCWRCVVPAKICIEGHSDKKVTKRKRKVENQVLSTIEPISFQPDIEQSLSEDDWLLVVGAIHQYSFWTLWGKRRSGLWKAQRVQWTIQLPNSYALWWTKGLRNTWEGEHYT